MRNAVETPDALVNTHLPLVSHAVSAIASRVPGSVAPADLVAAGAQGLRRAAEAFGASAEASFPAFAHPYIRNALLDELRGATRSSSPAVGSKVLAHLTTDVERATGITYEAIVLGGTADDGAADQRRCEQGPAAKRKAASYAAASAASDYRASRSAGGSDVAERVALTGLGG